MNAITKICLAIALLSFLISAGCETSTETSSKSLPEESTRAHADSENVTVSLCLSKLMHRLQSLQSEHRGLASLGSDLVFGFQPNHKPPRGRLNQNAAS